MNLQITLVKKVILNWSGDKDIDKDIDKYIDWSYSRAGQDIRYALDDSKLRKLGWEPKAQFNLELDPIIDYYKEKFIW